MNFMKCYLILFLILTTVVSGLYGQGNLKGQIVGSDNSPLIGATAVAYDSSGKQYGTASDQNGSFVLPVGTKDTYSVELSFLGYNTYVTSVNIESGETVDLGTVLLIESESVLQNVEVLGRRRRDYNSEYSFSSTKVAIANKELPQAISTITKELFKDRQTFQIADAISTASSVSHTGFYNHFSIRGLIKAEDGQDINGLRTRQFYFLQPITSHIERAEVVKGPSSITLSSTDAGGTVNLVTKKPLQEKRSEVSATVGSFGTLRAALDFTGPLNESKTLLYRLNAAVQESRSFRDLVQNNQFLLTPSVSYVPNETTALNVEMIYTSGEGNLDRGQPLFGAINGEFDINSTETTTNVAAANDFYISNEFMVISNFNKKFSDVSLQSSKRL